MCFDKKRLTAYWEQPDSITIGSRTLSFALPFGDSGKLDMEVKFIPKERFVLSRTISSNKAEPDYEILNLPDDIHTANDLITYVLKSNIGPMVGFGYELSQQLGTILNQILNNEGN